MAYTPQQIVDLVSQGVGPEGMYTGGDQSSRLAVVHEEIAGEVTQLQAVMQEMWQGEASGQAYAGAGPLVQASQVSGEHLVQAQGLYTGQGSSFTDLHRKIAAAGSLGDKPADDWVSGTPLSFLSNRSSEISAWNKKAQQVVDSYSFYHGQSSDNSGRWAVSSQYGELGVLPGGVVITPSESDTGAGSRFPVPVLAGPGDGTQHSGGGVFGYQGQGSGTAGAGVLLHGGSPGGSVSPISGAATPSPGSPGLAAPSQHGGAVVPDGGTVAAGYVSPSVPGGSAAGGGSVGGPGVSGGLGPGGSGTGGFGPVGGTAGFVAGGGFGPGGPGGPSGSGAGGLSSGKGSVAGVLGGQSEATGRAGGVPGGPGRPGVSGMGPVSPVSGMGRGGQGSGSAEHKTAGYLLERDPDDALIGELPPATPPVIGLRGYR